MNTVFIGGSRRVARLHDVARIRLRNIIERGLQVVIGDANGADRAVQAFLNQAGCRSVTVFCMEGCCRNNIGDWPVRAIQGGNRKGFEFFALKDEEMARSADCGLMLWDGESKGTFLNIVRLVALRKPVVVYFAPTHECVTVRTGADLDALLERRPPEHRRRLLSLLKNAPKQGRIFAPREREAVPTDVLTGR